MEKFKLKHIDIFLIFAQNIDCWHTLEPTRRGGSNEYPQWRGGTNVYPQSMFWAKISTYTLQTPVCLYKSGVVWGIHYTDMLSWCKVTNYLSEYADATTS